MKKSMGLALLLCWSLCGCLQNKDTLEIQADGSGKVVIETETSVSSEMFSSMGMGMQMLGGGGGEVFYPPVTEAEAKKFFPGKDFTVTTKEQKSKDGGTVLRVEAAFKDINALLGSPYAKAHALTLKVENGSLKAMALSGLESVARMAEIKDKDTEMFGAVPGLADMQKNKDKMRNEFRITLPNTLAATTGEKNGKMAAWTVERSKCKDADEFARKLGSVLKASCPADGLKMTPKGPMRLNLLPFKDLLAGAVAQQTKVPEAATVTQAAKFVPYALKVTRTLDLSGEGGGGRENGAQLFGAVILPRELAPEKWGEARLLEVTDAKGASLKLGGDQENFGARFNRHQFGPRMGEDESEDEVPTGPQTEEKRIVTLDFKAPDWKVKEIARVKATMALQYYGSSHLLKMSNAIPAAWIVSMEETRTPDFNPTQRAISDPKLNELGLTVQLQMAMNQAGMTILAFQLTGDKGGIGDVQVFDSEGHPWPTHIQQMDAGEGGSLAVMVAGKPQPPLSLALVAKSIGTSVELPIQLEHIPVGTK